MSDDPIRAPFAQPLPPQPKTAEEIEAEREEERQRRQEEAEQMANLPEVAPVPLTDEHVYQSQPTPDPKVTHAAMSTEELEELGYDEDGAPIGEGEPVQSEHAQEMDEHPESEEDDPGRDSTA